MTGAGTPRLDGRTSVVVVNYNTTAATARLVAPLEDSLAQVLVVDNASPDGSFDRFAASQGRVATLALDTNVGYGAAANRAAERLIGDVMILCNPDLVVEETALALLAAAARADGVAIAAPRFVFPDGTLQRSAHRRDPGLVTTAVDLSPAVATVARRLAPSWHPTLFPADAHAHPLDAHHVLGATMAIDLVAFRSVGGFDETFFLYREETDLCVRMRQRGWRIVHVPSATVVHEGAGSTPDGVTTQVRTAHLESHYRFIAKHRGRMMAAVARLVGLLASASWFLTGPNRSEAGAALRWHLGGRSRAVATLPTRGAARP